MCKNIVQAVADLYRLRYTVFHRFHDDFLYSLEPLQGLLSLNRGNIYIILFRLLPDLV